MPVRVPLARLLLAAAVGAAATAAAADCDPLRQSTFYLRNDLIGRGIRSPFTGFSLEVPHAPLYLRQPAFRELMRRLRDAWGLGVGPRIRVGGFTSETFAYSGSYSPRSARDPDRVLAIPGVGAVFGDDDVAALGLVADFNGSLTVGLNFVSPDAPGLAVGHLRALNALLPPGLLASIELGNEPDRFAAARVGFRRGSSGGKGWGYSAYAAEVTARLAALRAGLRPDDTPLPPLSGPAVTQDSPVWLRRLTDYATAFGAPDGGGGSRAAAEVNVHYYPLKGCGNGAYGPGHLLGASRPDFLDALLAAAAAGNLRPVVGEGNSVTCGGQFGLSETFAAGLWAVETWLGLLTAGATRFNAHGGPSYPYTPIALERARGGGGAWLVRPRALYYAAHVVATAAGGRAAASGFDRACCNRAAACSRQPWVRGYAFRAQSGELRLVVINRALPGGSAGAGWRTPQALQVAAPPEGLRRADGSTTPAVRGLWYLLSAPSLGSVTNISWAGLNFDGDASGASGAPASPLAPVELLPSRDGVFSPPGGLPPGSVGLLVLQPAAAPAAGGGAAPVRQAARRRGGRSRRRRQRHGV